jgi:hypothetical protein
MKRIRVFALRHFETTLIILILFGVIAIAFLVHYKFAFLNFFFLPVILAGYYLGKRQAVLTASLSVLSVILYLVFAYVLFRRVPPLTLDEILNVVIWAGFLILTGAIIGGIAEQREARLRNLNRAYIGVLEIMLKYLEVADENKPRSLRLAHLAGKIAQRMGLSTFQVENIKSAALLVDAGDLRSNLPLFERVAAFMETEAGHFEKDMAGKWRVLLTTTASLLKEVEPILANYFHHYVEDVKALDKNLTNIPIGSSIIALADLYDRLSTEMPTSAWGDAVRSLEDIQELSGRAFPAEAVDALYQLSMPVH